MSENRKYKLFFYISLVIFIILSLLFIYSKLRLNQLESLNEENQYLSDELKDLKLKEDETDKEYNKINIEYKNKRAKFISQYGYDSFSNKTEAYKNEKDKYTSRNIAIKSKILSEITKNSEYYKGKYYESQNLDAILSKIGDIQNSSKFINTNLYKELNLDAFLKEAKTDGTIGYLASLNPNSNANNILVFQTALYSQRLYEIANGLTDINDNILDLYCDIYATKDVFLALEKYGYNTGNLSSNKLDTMLNNIKPLMDEYYFNKLVIDSISEGDKNEPTK